MTFSPPNSLLKPVAIYTTHTSLKTGPRRHAGDERGEACCIVTAAAQVSFEVRLCVCAFGKEGRNVGFEGSAEGGALKGMKEGMSSTDRSTAMPFS
jgi:hypothetical protein